jgi:hypothetical protein
MNHTVPIFRCFKVKGTMRALGVVQERHLSNRMERLFFAPERKPKPYSCFNIPFNLSALAFS